MSLSWAANARLSQSRIGLISEKNIRSAFESDHNIVFRQGVEVAGINEDADTVAITYKDENGKETISKAFLPQKKRPDL